jgi:hypothetical protein
MTWTVSPSEITTHFPEKVASATLREERTERLVDGLKTGAGEIAAVAENERDACDFDAFPPLIRTPQLPPCFEQC